MVAYETILLDDVDKEILFVHGLHKADIENFSMRMSNLIYILIKLLYDLVIL